jgi:hypothetical protein
MKKSISALAALLLLTLSISVAPAGEPTYSSGIRKPTFGPVVMEDTREIEGYQIIRTIWTVTWTGTEDGKGMVGESVYDHIIIESPDGLLLSWQGIDTFTGTVGGSKPGTATFSTTGRTVRTPESIEGAVEGRFELISGSGTGGLKNLSSAHGVFQRQHDQPVGTYAIIYQFDDDDGDDDGDDDKDDDKKKRRKRR